MHHWQHDVEWPLDCADWLVGSDSDDEQYEAMQSDSEESERSEVSPSVAEDIVRFEESFKGLTEQYRIIDRIGEGTFSTVYKAEDLLYDQHKNDWDRKASRDDDEDEDEDRPPETKRRRTEQSRKKKFVAIKKIYVTSSPARIKNELQLLYTLRDCKAVCPIITAFRHNDQVVAILPYYRHHDFRDYYREMSAADIRSYLRSLFTGLNAVHKRTIIHRDIKPTNFLYDPHKGEGVLVDFGLAEHEGEDWSFCMCQDNTQRRRQRIEASYAASNPPPDGYPKNDTRPSRRANRAGTRGFRAPEVLFKCTNQSTKIDMWSVGVILLTILAQRFPFFHSADDIDALIEIASIVGRRRMGGCAILHGTTFMCTVPTVGEKGHSLEKLIMWSRLTKELDEEDKQAIKLLEQLLELDPKKRISAKEALRHDFLKGEHTGLAPAPRSPED